jgi:hypothetical protein
MVSAILTAARFGGDQAIAASRGEGKTSIAEAVAVYCLVQAIVSFIVLMSATGRDAGQVLANIREIFERADEYPELHSDYPEICRPITDLEGSAQRCKSQTAGGRRTHMVWSGDLLVFPTVWVKGRKSPASGAILCSRSIDGAIRGMRKGARRPDLVIADDIETKDSVKTDEQTGDRLRVLQKDAGGLGGPGRRIARVMLCTCQNRRSIAYHLTDPKAGWQGRRYQFLVTPPERGDLWETYVAQVAMDRQLGDPDARTAHRFYVEQRKEMDRGAVVGNPGRHIAEPTGDGTPQEVSALQAYYNLIARYGEDAVRSEYQNDPPEEDGPQTLGVTAGLVQSRTNGYPKRILPPDVQALVSFHDVGKYAIHWGVVAWQSDCKGHVVDYGVAEVYPSDRQDEKAVELAIKQTLHQWREQTLAEPYCDAAGVARPLDFALVDSGKWSDAIYAFAREVGQYPYRAAKGHGSARTLSAWSKKTTVNKTVKWIGEHWYVSIQKGGILLTQMHVDHWKAFVHERFLTAAGQPGSLTLFADHGDPRTHLAFARHIVAEELREEFEPGKGLVRKWHAVHRNNHWLDVLVGCCCAADMLGVRLLAPAPPPAPPRRGKQSRRARDDNYATRGGRKF